MQKDLRFGRLITAIITPFSASGELDYEVAEKFVDFQFQEGVDAVIATGTTGESPTVARDEKLSLYRAALNAADGRGAVIANIGSYNTSASVELALAAQEVGVAGLMAVVPYYNKPPQEGLYQHFSAIARAVPELPIILYNIPSRCVINMEPETIVRLNNANPNIVAVKEAGIDWDAVKTVMNETDGRVEYFSGNDEGTVDMIEAGGSGVISTTSNILPRRMKDMVEAAASGDMKLARQKEAELMPIMKGLFATSNPILVKKASELLGRPVGGVRLPLVDATPEQTNALEKILKSIGEL